MTLVWAKFLNYDAKKHMPQKIGTLHFIKIKGFCCLNYQKKKKKGTEEQFCEAQVLIKDVHPEYIQVLRLHNQKAKDPRKNSLII